MGAAIMGGDANNMEQAFGIYYLETRDKSPFIKPNVIHENVVHGRPKKYR